ncbi:hypothetical protein WBG78_10750 [Chryseolinea sp. T2]|uniref:hypothetical protein n=1 Tax=Chryseolinea sp. T2 TaxID=3129255 RepID=UPI003077128A
MATSKTTVMATKWFNRIEFYLLCVIPIPALQMVNLTLGSGFFLAGLLLYVLWYRPFVHIYRLRKLGVIEEAEAWRFFMPFYANRYMRELWLG